MTWTNRLRLFAGVLIVIVFVATLTIIFNQRQNRITSFTGEVAADVYTVGADHPGTVTAQFVEPGEQVTPGMTLFTIQSVQLKEELANGLDVGDTDAYKVNRSRGTITYFAVTDGVVTKLNARLGNSVPAGEGLATITSTGNRFVTASFRRCCAITCARPACRCRCSSWS